MRRIVFVSTATCNYENYRHSELLGTEYQIFGLARALSKRDFKVTILRRWYDNRYVDHVDGVRLVNVSAPYLLDSPLNLMATRLIFSKLCARIISKMRPDIVVLSNKFTAYHILNLDIPKVFVTHEPLYDDTLPGDTIFSMAWLIKRPINLKVEKKCFQKSSAIVALNKSLKMHLEREYSNVFLIPNGIDYENYKELPEKPYILFIGRISKEKGVHILLEAFSKFVNENGRKDIKLVMAGPAKRDSYYREIAKIIKSNKLQACVSLLPFVPMRLVRKLLAECMVLVLPSLHETFGIVVLETMASGKPVIASDIPGPNEIIINNVNGMLFRKGSVDELKACLEKVLLDDNLRRRLSTFSKLTAKNYSFDAIAEKYIKVFNEIGR